MVSCLTLPVISMLFLFTKHTKTKNFFSVRKENTQAWMPSHWFGLFRNQIWLLVFEPKYICWSCKVGQNNFDHCIKSFFSWLFGDISFCSSQRDCKNLRTSQNDSNLPPEESDQRLRSNFWCLIFVRAVDLNQNCSPKIEKAHKSRTFSYLQIHVVVHGIFSSTAESWARRMLHLLRNTPPCVNIR